MLKSSNDNPITFQFYYILSQGLLLPYFNTYLDVTDRDYRAQNSSYTPTYYKPIIRTYYNECNLLFQIIKIINTVRRPSNTMAQF